MQFFGEELKLLYYGRFDVATQGQKPNVHGQKYDAHGQKKPHP